MTSSDAGSSQQIPRRRNPMWLGGAVLTVGGAAIGTSTLWPGGFMLGIGMALFVFSEVNHYGL